MGRSNKANLPWVDAVGEKIVEGLVDRYRRPMIFLQSGPYQSNPPFVGIYFNDPILHYVKSSKADHTADFRFGFYIQRCYSKDRGSYTLEAGFDLHNPTLSDRFFFPNLIAHRATVSERLLEWARQTSKSDSYIWFRDADGTDYFTDWEDSASSLEADLLICSDRKNKKDALRWRNINFEAMRELRPFLAHSEETLQEEAEAIASAALCAFEELDFLYDLLFPRGLGPARTSNDQNRALRRKQPARLCSWSPEDNCRGDVQAAHIKPDYLGGLAVPGNLIWLCRFHHALLDLHLRGRMRIDRAAQRIIACVSNEPPNEEAGKGAAIAIWTTIPDRSAWPLPLKPESISHLFD